MSVQSEIDRIKKNVNETLKTISDTGVTVGAGSDSLPAAAAALANKKQDKLSGTAGQVVGFDADGNAVAQDAPSGGTSSYVVSFTADQWTAGTGESTITIPAATHKLSGDIVDCKSFALVSGRYRSGVWASLETYATAEENGDIVLHYSDTSGYAGAAVLTAYDITP